MLIKFEERIRNAFVFHEKYVIAANKKIAAISKVLLKRFDNFNTIRNDKKEKVKIGSHQLVYVGVHIR